jgi:tetratricopeptide (TPR) repeat protein
MKKRSNINSIINARGLARKLIDADPKNKGKSLQVLNLVNMKFDKYLFTDNEGNPIPVVMDEEYVAKKALEFIHSSKGDSAENAYRSSKFKGDFSQNSLYDACGRILSRDEEVTGCFGSSPLDKILLGFKGIESDFVGYPTHVALDAKINGKIVHLESTMPDGFGYEEKRKPQKNFEIISAAKLHLANASHETGEYKKAIEICGDAIKINPKNSYAYSNRAFSLFRTFNFKGMLRDSEKAIKLDKNNNRAYLFRAISEIAFEKYNDAIKDFKKYASFSEDNKKEATEYISQLEEKIRDNRRQKYILKIQQKVDS